MNFASDNRGPAHPKILQALIDANSGHSPSYGDDALTEEVTQSIRDVFEAPDAAVFLCATGTATNALILATLAQPWDEIYAAPESHISHDECNAVEFYTGGARIKHVGDGDKLIASELQATMSSAAPHDIHNAQVGPVSIVQVTDLGGVYTLDEIRSITDVAKSHGSAVHLDGARFANALVSLDCSPAEMTWKSGIDAVSFGGTKNGCLGVEAAVFFDPKHAMEFELRRKRAGHLFSKHRFLAAQMGAYLKDDLWLEMARSANHAAQRLFAGLTDLGATFLRQPDANLGFPYLPRAMHARALAAGAIYEMEEPIEGDPNEALISRFVCDWSLGDADVDAVLDALSK